MIAVGLWIQSIIDLRVIWKGQGELRGKPHWSNRCEASAACKDHHLRRREDSPTGLTRMFHELQWRDHEDGRATGQPQGVGPEAYLNGTSQGPIP
jgi:hypothetical protein